MNKIYIDSDGYLNVNIPGNGFIYDIKVNKNTLAQLQDKNWFKDDTKIVIKKIVKDYLRK